MPGPGMRSKRAAMRVSANPSSITSRRQAGIEARAAATASAPFWACGRPGIPASVVRRSPWSIPGRVTVFGRARLRIVVGSIRCHRVRRRPVPLADRSRPAPQAAQRHARRSVPGLMMPALCQAISGMVGPRVSVWSRPIVVMTATEESTTLVRSKRPPAPTSITATSGLSRAIARATIAIQASP